MTSLSVTAKVVSTTNEDANIETMTFPVLDVNASDKAIKKAIENYGYALIKVIDKKVKHELRGISQSDWFKYSVPLPETQTRREMYAQNKLNK
jgi:hypothetical protein